MAETITLSKKVRLPKILKVEVTEHESVDGVHSIVSRRELTGEELKKWKKEHGYEEEPDATTDD